MPKFDIDLSDGRTITVESDHEPNEEEVFSALGEAESPAVDIGSQFLFTPDPFDPRQIKRRQLESEAAELREIPPPSTARGFVEELIDRFGDFPGGIAQYVPSTLRAIGAGMSRPDTLAENVPMVEPPPPGPPEQHPVYQAGEMAQQFVDETFPQPEEFSFPRAVVRGAGQMVPMLAGGAAARALGASPAVATAAGAAIAAPMEFDDAFTRARRRGDDADTAFAKSLGYATVAGLIENRLGAGRILRQMFPNPVQAAQKLTGMGVSKKILGNFLAGGAEEGSQQFAQNWIVEGEPSMEGVAESAAVGSVVEGVAGLPSAAVTPQTERKPEEITAPSVETVRAQRELEARQKALTREQLEDAAIEKSKEVARQSPDVFKSKHPESDPNSLSLEYQKSVNTAIAERAPVYAAWADQLQVEGGALTLGGHLRNLGYTREGDVYVFKKPKKGGEKPDAIHPEGTPIPRPVQQPEVTPKGAGEVPAAEGGQKATEALDEWETFSEALLGDLEAFSPARHTGRVDYDMQDVANRFVEFAKSDTSGLTPLKLVSAFAKVDEATPTQIKKLRESLKNVESAIPKRGTKAPEARVIDIVNNFGSMPLDQFIAETTGSGVSVTKAGYDLALRMNNSDKARMQELEAEARKRTADFIAAKDATSAMKENNRVQFFNEAVRMYDGLQDIKTGKSMEEIAQYRGLLVEEFRPFYEQATKGTQSEKEAQEVPIEEAEPVGMGAATPSEFQPPKPFATSNKNAVVDEERKERGLPPMMNLARQGNQEAWDSAMRQIDENPQIQDELLTELASKPRALTATENAMLLHRRVDLRNEYEKALLRWRQAFEDNDLLRASEESQRVRDWSSKLSDLEDITKATGAESGRSLQARKMMANEDYSLAAMELRAMEAKGRNLTPEEHIQLIQAQQRILELENRLLELEGQKEAKETEAATTETMTEVAREAPKEAKSKDFDLDREEVLLSGIKAKVDKGQTNDITSLVQQLARVFWRRGIRGREPMIDALHDTLKLIIPTFTREDTKRAFSGYGNFKPLSKEEIDVGLRDLRGQTQQVLKMEALEARKPLEKTGQERRVPTDEERRLIKQVNELKRKYGVVVTDPATQLKSALAARKTYYEHRIADLKHEIETRQRIVKSKTASPTDPELQALIAEHERLKQEHAQIFVKPEMSDEQRLRMAIAAAQRNLAHWEVRLDNAEKGIFDKRVPGRTVTSAELELIQAEAAAIREHVKELENLSKPKKSKEEIALQSLKTRMKTREAEFRRRILEKDFAKKVRQPVKLDAEGLRLKAALDLAKQEFETKMEQDRWARMSVFQKTKRKIADVYDAARALMTTGEFSFILRQGKLAVLSHPIQTAKALPDMFRALLASEPRAHEIDLQTHNDPEADAARAAKLYLVEEGPSLHKQEEILMGRWVGKIPVVKNFNRAAQVFLNRIRLDMWKAMRKSLTKSGTPTPEEDRQIAMFVNEATGRGGLGKLEPAAVPLARVMFSPRYYASRLQLAAGHSLWGGTMRTRRIIATEYARALVGLGLYYTALSMLFQGDDDDPEKGKIEADPRSADFGKVKVGNTRLDPLAGISQVAVLASRTATGEKKTLAGEVQSIRGPEVKFGGDKWSDIVARHLRGKLHPVPGSIANLFDGTDLGGDEATVINQTQNLIAPITYMDIYAALKEQGLDDGAALALLGLLGEGIQTYKEREK